LDPETWRDGDRRAFYVENQDGYVWSTDGDRGSDPVVWGRSTSESAWSAEREPLSRFLVQVLIFEAVIGADHAATAPRMTLPELEELLAPLSTLPFGAWRWPSEPTWFYAGEDILAIAGPNDTSPTRFASHYNVFISARTAAALAYARRLDVEWSQTRR
jgi:hypothetical protein